jgi:1-phosphofructokinase family hexose kinase
VILCVAPNPSIDKLFEVERLEPGGIHRPTSFVQVPGGKGLNVARAAATLGADVRAVALLGGAGGRWIADELEAIGITLSAVWHDGNTRSCLSVADADTQSLTEFYEDGPRVEDDAWRELVSRVGEQATTASWVAVSGSLPPGTPDDGYEQLGRGAHLAVDATSLGTARPALVKVNAEEAAQMTGLQTDTAERALAAAHELRKHAGGEGHAAIVTIRSGAALVDPDGRAWQGRLDASGPYPVGSGDALLAGLLVTVEQGASWPDALSAGLGAGAANAELPGAGRLDRSRAERLRDSASVIPAGER